MENLLARHLPNRILKRGVVTEFIHQMKIFLIKINSYVTDRPYILVTESTNTPSSSKESNAEETSAGFMKVSHEIVRLFHKSGPRKKLWKKAWKKENSNRHKREGGK